MLQDTKRTTMTTRTVATEASTLPSTSTSMPHNNSLTMYPPLRQRLRRRHQPQTTTSTTTTITTTTKAKAIRTVASLATTSQWLSAITIIVCLVAGVLISPTNGLANCPNGCECDDDTLVVKCGEGTLDVLPIALNPSIQRLVIKNNKIKTIDSSIQFYAELTFLDLSFNDLVTIPQRTFGYQRKLQELHLDHNKIGQISNKTFMGLSSLLVLNLRGNLLAELEADTFLPMPKIEELNLGNNRISRIDVNAFEGMVNLRVLYLDDNTLTSVPAEMTFSAMPNLAELYLGTNSFTTIPAGAFSALKGLTRLDLKGAGLHNVSGAALIGLEGVRYLDLSDNSLEHIPTASLSQLERLEELNLGQNDFEVINDNAFAGLKNLRRLDITGAQHLRRVQSGAFSSNTNLEYLNLSSNKMLTEIQEGAFSGLPHLRHIILKENQLHSMSEGLFPWTVLQTIDFSDNPIVCDCLVLWLRNVLVSKNATNDAVPNVICAYPEPLRGAPLKDLTPTLLGCSYHDPNQKAMIGIFIVCSVATITTLTIIIYRCRRRIRDIFKCGWGNSALGRKEREYQKTFSDEEYMTRQQHPCSLGIHSAGYPSSYNPHQTQYMGSRPIPVTEL